MALFESGKSAEKRKVYVGLRTPSGAPLDLSSQGSQLSSQQPSLSTQARKSKKRFGGDLLVTLVLIALNVLAYLYCETLSVQRYNELVLSSALLERGSYITLLTSMFMHADISHISNNMLSLFFLGASLEPRIGRCKFLLIYMMSGIAGGLAFVGSHLALSTPATAVGASGAIFGLFGAYGYIIWRTHMLYGRNDGSPATEINLAWFAIMLVENIGYGLANPGIANSAHVGGLICGFVLAKLLFGKRLRGVSVRRAYGKASRPRLP